MSERFWRGKRVLITGGTGFIGSHLTRELLRHGASLLLLTHGKDNPWRIAPLSSHLSLAPWTAAADLPSLLQEFDPELIFHLATFRNVGRSLNLMDEMMESNVNRTLSLAKAALSSAKSLKLFVNTGTCEEYGNLPAPFSETMRERPISPYSLGKTLSIQSIEFLSRIGKLPAINVRPFTTYGGWQVADMLVPQVIVHGLEGKELKMSSGEQTRDFIHVDDMVDAYLHLGEAFSQGSEDPKGEIFNIATGVECRVRDIVEQIVRMMGSKGTVRFGAQPIRAGEPVHFFADIQKITQTGWKPKVNLTEGLSRTIKWYQDHYASFRDQLCPPKKNLDKAP